MRRRRRTAAAAEQQQEGGAGGAGKTEEAEDENEEEEKENEGDNNAKVVVVIVVCMSAEQAGVGVRAGSVPAANIHALRTPEGGSLARGGRGHAGATQGWRGYAARIPRDT